MLAHFQYQSRGCKWQSVHGMAGVTVCSLPQAEKHLGMALGRGDKNQEKLAHWGGHHVLWERRRHHDHWAALMWRGKEWAAGMVAPHCCWWPSCTFRLKGHFHWLALAKSSKFLERFLLRVLAKVRHCWLTKRECINELAEMLFPLWKHKQFGWMHYSVMGHLDTIPASFYEVPKRDILCERSEV